MPMKRTSPQRGQIGALFGVGDIVLTVSGRQTTPFPKVAVDTDRKVTNTLRRVEQWLMQNAIDEARARGDAFNARIFEHTLDRPSPSDKDSAEEYLFGAYVPPVRQLMGGTRAAMARPAQPRAGASAGRLSRDMRE